MALALADRMDAPGPVLVAGLAVFNGHFAMMTLYSALHHAIRRRRVLPVAVRNLDMSEAGIPQAPPAYLYRRHLRKVLHLDLPAHAGLLTALATGTRAPAVIGYALTTGPAVAAVLALLGQFRRARRMPGRGEVLAAVNRQLAD